MNEKQIRRFIFNCYARQLQDIANYGDEYVNVELAAAHVDIFKERIINNLHTAFSKAQQKNSLHKNGSLTK